MTIQSNAYISQLGTPPPQLIGRERELAQLDAAWTDPSCNLLCITGEDGVGKSSLTNNWLNHPAQQQADIRIFGWSFYSQGSVANQTVAADFFIHKALAWFGDPDPAQGSGWDKGARLAELIGQEPTLLILDGLELLQASPETEHIGVRDPAVRVLLHELAVNNPGLGLISSRCPLRNLSQFPDPQVRILALPNLSPEAGAALLQARGVTGRELELIEASRSVDGHPLALTLLSSFVQDALAGDLRRLAEIPPPPADGKPGEQARRLMEAYGKWLGQSPEQSILRLLGLYLRPTDGDSPRRFLVPPAIPKLTDQLFTLKEQRALGFFRKKEEWPISRQAWHTAVANLRRANLLLPAASTDPDEADYQLDAHPLVRKYFARQLGNDDPRAWYQGHERLYRYFSSLTEEYPQSLSAMALLYTAVLHGCRANDFEAALDQIYWTRIARKQEFYSTKELGVPGADLAALANAFRQPWKEPVKSLSKVMQATVLNWAAALLQIQGRLEEAR